jgi:hypothetical protein
VRDTEFLPEVEISSEIKIQAKEDGREEDQDNEYSIIERQRHFWPKAGKYVRNHIIDDKLMLTRI